jgi:hypothetical protein
VLEILWQWQRLAVRLPEALLLVKDDVSLHRIES